MIDQAIQLVSDRTVRVNSTDTIREMRSLIEDKGKIQAPPGGHDDCVIALAIAIQMLIIEKETARLYANVATDIMMD